ncbi:MAG: hypothetical protein NC390_03840 [Fusobacterium sp.]|nr:hypothetical protein [Fusobacterium sp.]
MSSASKRFEALITSIEAKIKNQLCAYTPQKLDSDIKTVMKEVPDASEQQVLTVMQRLTQWANYTCLPQLAKKLSALNIKEMANNSKLNESFYYLQKYKGLFELNRHGERLAHITTQSELPLCVEKKHPKNTSFINLEGFEDGVNLFTNDNKLAEKTIATLRKVQNFRNNHPDKTFKQALFTVLNGRIRKEMSSYGHTVKTICNHRPETRENILAQMQPYAPPSRNEITSTIETLAKHFGGNAQEISDLKIKLADYYDCKLNIFSKQRIIEDLQTIKSKIDKYIHKHRIPENNVRYVIPDELGVNKSFGLITYMFAQNYNIEPKKIMRLNSISDLKYYPENNVFVILDDFSGSGDTLTQACDYYLESWRLKKKQHIIFAPITACESAINNIKANIELASREKLDTLLTVDKNIQKYSKTARELLLDRYFFSNPKGIEIFGYEGYKNEKIFSGCNVFPYMAPDNNSALSSFLIRYFLPNPKGIKNQHIDFDTIVKQVDDKMLKIMN